jgi:hypothetical protein
MASMPASAAAPGCPVRSAIPAIDAIRLDRRPERISHSTRRAGTISRRGWSREFDDPILLPLGPQLVTIEDAANYIQKAAA